MPTITDLLFGGGMAPGGGMSSIQSMLQSLRGGMNPIARGGMQPSFGNPQPGGGTDQTGPSDVSDMMMRVPSGSIFDSIRAMRNAGGMQQGQDANPGTPFDPWAASRAMAGAQNPQQAQTLPFYMGGGTAPGGGIGAPKPLNIGPAPGMGDSGMNGSGGGTDWNSMLMQLMSGMGGGMQGGMGNASPILQAIQSAMGRMPGAAPSSSIGGAVNSLMRYR